jgi:branched-chain amino acid transport system ATP-binding protein
MLEVKKLMVFYENSLAINNINAICQRDKITGIFGANSAGKSTLMYTISGIILDIKKKEEMKGGERITVLGNIIFNEVDISHMKPSEIWLRSPKPKKLWNMYFLYSHL